MPRLKKRLQNQDENEFQVDQEIIDANASDYYLEAHFGNGFRELRAKALVPNEILDLVQARKGHQFINLKITKTSATGRPEYSAQIVRRHRQRTAKPRIGETTALDALAYILRTEMRRHRYARKTEGGALVRLRGYLEQSLIAEIAMVLLIESRASRRSPSLMLLSLFGDLINPGRLAKYRNAPEAGQRNSALILVGREESLGVRKLARRVGVSASTASRWLKDKSFLEEAKQRNTLLKGIRAYRAPPGSKPLKRERTSY